MRQRRRLAFPEICEDQPNVLPHRISGDADFVRKRSSLRGLFDALAAAVVFPAVIKAADALSFDPSDGELRAPMRAARADQMRIAALTAIEREILAQDADRQRATR